jgi:hypothetical protein
MREPAISADIAKKLPTAINAPASWVCLALGLSILALGFRIVSMW